MQIRRLTDTVYQGVGIVNQPVQQTVSTNTDGTTVRYAVKLVNNGPIEACYLLQGLASDANWTVRYFDALVDGADITLPLTVEPGWAVTLAPGQARELRVEVTPNNGLSDLSTVTVQIVTMLIGDTEFDSPKTLAAFALGLVLFIVTLALNVVALQVVRKYREQYE